MSTPTDRWLAAVTETMPPLTGAEGTAERLLLHVHFGVDWETSWVAARRTVYWDRILPDRVITATYRTDELRRWWRDVADDLVSAPRNREERVELETLLRADSLPVLELLRWQTEPLLLRTRITADGVRSSRIRREVNA